MTIYQNTIAGSGFLQGPTGATGPAANTTIIEYEYVAAQGQTTFSGNDKYGNSLSYAANGIFVALNGSLLNELEEYSAINGSSITLNQGASANDELVIYTLPAFNVANTYTQQQANTIFLDRTTANGIFASIANTYTQTQANTTFLKLSGGTISGNVNFANGANLLVPVGNTAQRPAAAQGYIRYNTDLNTLESANATAWANVGSGSASSGGTGGLSWQTVQNTNFIAVAGNGYAVNTFSSNVIVTLPASPTVGNFLTITDYARTFANNSLTIYPNGNKLSGNTANASLTIAGESVSLVYIDSNQGWISYSAVYTSPVAAYPVSYLLVGGGGAGGTQQGGGGGAGGLLFGQTTVLSGTSYAISVGVGGTSAPNQTYGTNTAGTSGTNSSGLGQTALGGGVGGCGFSINPSSGGSGGGGASGVSGGSGTFGQGNSGGSGYSGTAYGGGGGGGAGASGTPGTSNNGSPGGNGLAYSISGSSVTYAGGGGGGYYFGGPGPGGAGGSGGGGAAAVTTGAGTNGTAGLGGGGGGGTNTNSGSPNNTQSGAGGAGIVIISYPYPQRALGGTVTISNGQVIHTYTASGTFTA